MYCDRHKNTELMRKEGGTKIQDNKTYTLTFLYCPHCAKDKYRLLEGDGEAFYTKLQ
jgi:hypothetical protein